MHVARMSSDPSGQASAGYPAPPIVKVHESHSYSRCGLAEDEIRKFKLELDKIYAALAKKPTPWATCKDYFYRLMASGGQAKIREEELEAKIRLARDSRLEALRLNIALRRELEHTERHLKMINPPISPAVEQGGLAAKVHETELKIRKIRRDFNLRQIRTHLNQIYQNLATLHTRQEGDTITCVEGYEIILQWFLEANLVGGEPSPISLDGFVHTCTRESKASPTARNQDVLELVISRRSEKGEGKEQRVRLRAWQDKSEVGKWKVEVNYESEASLASTSSTGGDGVNANLGGARGWMSNLAQTLGRIKLSNC